MIQEGQAGAENALSALMERRGFVNGGAFVNRTGLTNGNGFVNGNGLATRKGLTNGNGFVNGLNGGSSPVKAMNPLEKPLKRGPFAPKKTRLVALLAAGLVLGMMLPVAAVMMASAPDRMAIDGNFADWDGKAIISDTDERSAVPPDLDIVHYSTTVVGGYAYFYLQVAGRVLSGKSSTDAVDVVNIFIDTDMDPGSGYSIQGIGADFRIEVYGWDGQVRGSSLQGYSLRRTGLDWNGWANEGGATAAAQGNRLEMAVPQRAIGISGSGLFEALFQTMDPRSGAGDIGSSMAGPHGGALLVTQKPVDNSCLPVPGERAAFLELELAAQAREVRLRQLVLTRSGNAVDPDIGTVHLRSGTTELASGTFAGDVLKLALDLTVAPHHAETVCLSVDIPATAISGRTFGAGLAGHGSINVEKGTPTVQALGWPTYYLGEPARRITVDGAFGDWDAYPSNADPAGDCGNPNLDIIDCRAAKDQSTVSFYARVDGSMLGGTISPASRIDRPVISPSLPAPTSSFPVEPPTLVAADTVKIFIDSDDSPLTGCRAEGQDFGADLSLVVTGTGGRILTREAYCWSSPENEWRRLGTFEAAVDPTRMELQAPLGMLGLSPSATIRALEYASDWRENADCLDRPIVLRDPLVLADNSSVYHSNDGTSWPYEGDINTGYTFRDLCVDSSGNVYALQQEGDVYKSTGDWSCWSEIIDSAMDSFVALATNDTDFFALQLNGDVYTATSGGSWSKQGTIGVKNLEDMCIDDDGNLYAVRISTQDTVYQSTDAGQTWSAFGDKNVDAVDLDQSNVAIVYGPGWNGTHCLFILQTDGNVRYDTDGTTASPWNTISPPANSVGLEFMDLAIDNSGGTLWTLTLSGKVYSFDFDDEAPNGTWNTSLGDSSGGSGAAIAVNLVPEFQDLALPLGGMIAIFVIVRARGRKTRG